ncbi:hypothetical protein PIB30_090652 [Stylosanthes scabra]|uniref:Secreted protein n=1 Tax=Stylosanthes scabra TaxID=79078 RepID=A0ABU6TTY0_9FABA|nr:hypothetical protein [Stylosanthes scabra]
MDRAFHICIFMFGFLVPLSTGSLFHGRSITLGSLIGISSFLELSRRSGRMVVENSTREENKRNHHHHKLKPCLFSLCSRLSTDDAVASSGNDVIVPSLGHYLEVERRARDAIACATSNQINTTITHRQRGSNGGMSPRLCG